MAKFTFHDLVINVDLDEDGVPVFGFGCQNTKPQGCGGGTKRGQGCDGNTEPGCGNTKPGCGNTEPGCGGGTQPGCNDVTGCLNTGCGGGTKLFGVQLDSAANIKALQDKLREVIDHLDILEQEQGGGD